MTEAYLPDPTDPLRSDPADEPGGTSVPVPVLDRPISHGVSSHSQGHLLAVQIIETADRAEQYADRGDDDEARRHRAYVVGMLMAYNTLVRVVLDTGESNPRLQYVYEGALADVRADLEESTAFWGPIHRREVPALERYHRLTKVQQARPDAAGLADPRAAALSEVYREGGWTYRTLATETGMSVGRVQQLMARADDHR
jgi:hypothetical protein